MSVRVTRRGFLAADDLRRRLADEALQRAGEMRLVEIPSVLVSGSRTVREVRPAIRLTTITQLHAAIERKVPARSL